MSRVLIVPMAAGSLGRAITLAQALESKGHIVSLCVASNLDKQRICAQKYLNNLSGSP